MKQYISEETLSRNKFELYYMTPKENWVYQKKGKNHEDYLVVSPPKDFESVYGKEQTYFEIIKIVGGERLTEGIQLAIDEEYVARKNLDFKKKMKAKNDW